MTRLSFPGAAGTTLDIDMCGACHAFWFDGYENLQLPNASTLTLFRQMSELPPSRRPPTLSPAISCPRCQIPLVKAHDWQQGTPFEYWRCDNGHGRFMTFLDFLREKSYVEPMMTTELAALRRKLHMVTCHNCGGAVDLMKDPVCPYCGSPLSA
jgi:hypothetical protein